METHEEASNMTPIYKYYDYTTVCSQSKDAHKLKGYLCWNLFTITAALIFTSTTTAAATLLLLTPEASVLSALSISSRASLLNISAMINSCDSTLTFFAPYHLAEAFAQVFGKGLFSPIACNGKSAVIT